jgi:hypothetical protein
MGDGTKNTFIIHLYEDYFKPLLCRLCICNFAEDVIRRRLLIDGDGTGDDRRLNVLLKSFIKWCNASNEPPGERYAHECNQTMMCYVGKHTQIPRSC